MDYRETASKYIDSLKIRAINLREEGKEFEVLEIERIIMELATIFNLPQYL